MKGNERLGLTAELVALMRQKKKVDKYSSYFVTPRIRKISSIVSLFFPKSTIQGILDKRIKLSKEIQTFVKQYKPEQVIEVASGSSVFGLEYSQKHSKIVYIETDLSEVIRKKRSILKQILQAENLKANPNHILVPVDVLADDVYKTLEQYLRKGKRTIVIAEGLTSYFDEQQYMVFVDNINRLLEKVGGGAYLSHEVIKGKMVSGIGFRILRGFVTAITGSKSHQHFHSKEELINYFAKKRFKEIKHHDGDSGYVFLMEKQLG